ncbi:MAG: Na/Pi cotransporter family protein [Lachnospiraceae bacterium]|nr:Na/Pi cotransporter family protein [Lachnospiraceae bacterium]
MITLITSLMSGLALFLFGMKFMSESLQKAAGDSMRRILDKVTTNKITAVLFGAIFTAIIQSSGATTVMEVSFVNAGLLTLEKSVGITFGANIGTTITSQLVSLKLTAVAPYIVFVGAILIMFGSKPITRKVAEILFGFGALFLGINFMTGAFDSIQQYPVIMHIFSYMKNPFVALLIGLIFTLITQSSSVTISVLVLLADVGLVGLGSCLYFILGANIGSCMPAVTSAFNTNADAKRTAAVHVMFNVFGMIVISIILFFFKDQIISMIAGVSGADNYKRFVANADTIFKTFQTIIFLPLSSQFLKLSRVLIKDVPVQESEEEQITGKHLQYIGRTKKFQSATAVVEITEEILRMARIAQANMNDAIKALLEDDLDAIDNVKRREEVLDYLSNEITNYLVKVNKIELPLQDSDRIGSLFHVVNDIERIGDHAMNFVEDAEKKIKHNDVFTEKGNNEIKDMHQKVMKLYEDALTMFITQDKRDVQLIIEEENEIDALDNKLQKKQVKRVSRGEIAVETGIIYNDIVIGLERMADHSTNIAYSIFTENPEEMEEEEAGQE